MTSPNDFLFTGEQRDPNSGFYYLRARYMNPANGRFTQQDSFDGAAADPQSLHKYLYANGDPVGRSDPSGMFSLGEVTAAMNIRNTLANLQMDFEFNFMDAMLDPDNAGRNMAIGVGIVEGLNKPSSPHARSTICGTGIETRRKVAKISPRKPLFAAFRLQ